MHIGSTQDHTRMAAGLSLLSVGCFSNQSALLHYGPSIKDSRQQLKHRVSFQEIYFLGFSWLILVPYGRRSSDLMVQNEVIPSKVDLVCESRVESWL